MKNKAQVRFEYLASVEACPFCGKWDLILRETQDEDEPMTFVMCENCCTTGPEETTPTKAIEIWNERKAPEPVPEETRQIKVK